MRDPSDTVIPSLATGNPGVRAKRVCTLGIAGFRVQGLEIRITGFRVTAEPQRAIKDGALYP